MPYFSDICVPVHSVAGRSRSTTMDIPPKNDVGTQCEAPHNEPKMEEAEEKWAFADQPMVESVTSTDVPP